MMEYRAGATVSSQTASAALDVDRVPAAGLSVFLHGTFTATAAPEVSHDGTTWVPAQEMDGTDVASKTAAGMWVIVGTFKHVRLDVSAHSSGDCEWGVVQ